MLCRSDHKAGLSRRVSSIRIRIKTLNRLAFRRLNRQLVEYLPLE